MSGCAARWASTAASVGPSEAPTKPAASDAAAEPKLRHFPSRQPRSKPKSTPARSVSPAPVESRTSGRSKTGGLRTPSGVPTIKPRPASLKIAVQPVRSTSSRTRPSFTAELPRSPYQRVLLCHSVPDPITVLVGGRSIRYTPIPPSVARLAYASPTAPKLPSTVNQLPFKVSSSAGSGADIVLNPSPNIVRSPSGVTYTSQTGVDFTATERVG